MFTSFLTRAVNTFPGIAKAERKRMLRDMGEIGELNIIEECTIGSESKIGELQNKLIISDRTASQTIVKEKKNTKRN